MKTQIILVFCSLLLVSCRCADNEVPKPFRCSYENRTVLPVPDWYAEMVNCGKRLCDYKVRAASYLYVVNGVVVGRSEDSLQEYLAFRKKGSIVFYSDYKILADDAKMRLNNIFVENGAEVKQFLGCTFVDPCSDGSSRIILADTVTGEESNKTYDYEVRLYSRVYLVNGVVVGQNRSSLRNYLALQQNGTVCFISDYKCVWEQEQEYKALFVELGFQVEGFSIPRSAVFQPGQ